MGICINLVKMNFSFLPFKITQGLFSFLSSCLRARYFRCIMFWAPVRKGRAQLGFGQPWWKDLSSALSQVVLHMSWVRITPSRHGSILFQRGYPWNLNDCSNFSYSTWCTIAIRKSCLVLVFCHSSALVLLFLIVILRGFTPACCCLRILCSYVPCA